MEEHRQVLLHQIAAKLEGPDQIVASALAREFFKLTDNLGTIAHNLERLANKAEQQ